METGQNLTFIIKFEIDTSESFLKGFSFHIMLTSLVELFLLMNSLVNLFPRIVANCCQLGEYYAVLSKLECSFSKGFNPLYTKY